MSLESFHLEKLLSILLKLQRFFLLVEEVFQLNLRKQKVAEINRRDLDKQIALQAKKVVLRFGLKQVLKEFQKMGLKLQKVTLKCKIIVDARGASALISKDRNGMLSSAQFEVLADWIKKGKVEVYFDQEKFPGFFAWIIPTTDGVGKVGVAGRGTNVADAISSFLNSKGKYSIIRKIFAPIWINRSN